MVKPITFEEVSCLEGKTLPKEVIEVINNLLKTEWDGQSGLVVLSLVEIRKQLSLLTDVYNSWYLPLIIKEYSSVGWDVKQTWETWLGTQLVFRKLGECL